MPGAVVLAVGQASLLEQRLPDAPREVRRPVSGSAARAGLAERRRRMAATPRRLTLPIVSSFVVGRPRTAPTVAGRCSTSVHELRDLHAEDLRQAIDRAESVGSMGLNLVLVPPGRVTLDSFETIRVSEPATLALTVLALVALAIRAWPPRRRIGLSTGVLNDPPSRP